MTDTENQPHGASLTKAANAILLAVSAVCAAILMRYAIAGWQLGASGDSGISIRAMVLFYVIPAVVCPIFAWIALGARNAALKANVALAACATVLSLYVLEAAVSLLFPAQSPNAFARNIEAAKKKGIEFDSRPKYEVIAQMRKNGAKVNPQFALSPLYGKEEQYFTPGLLPLAGLSDTTVVVCNELGSYMIYRTDEHGFNNPPGLYAAPADVMMVGGSYVEGECVKPGETAPDVIRKSYPRTLNLGMGGTGPLQMLARLREYGRVAKPKVVIWLHNAGDMDGIMGERQTKFLMKYLEPSFLQDLASRQAEVDRALRGMLEKAQAEHEAQRVRELEQIAREDARWWKHIVFGSLRTRLGLMTIADPASKSKGRADEILVEFDRVLKLAKAETDSWGGKLLFAYISNPVMPPVAPEFLPAPILGRVEAQGVPAINLHDALVRHPDQASLFALGDNWNHPNEAGYRLIGETLVRRLREDPKLK